MSPELRKLYPFNLDHHFSPSEGIRMHYLDEGSGEPIVMLHGNPTWSFFFRNLVGELKPYGRCLVPDHIGCGLSDKPQNYPYRLKTPIENTIGWLEHLKIERFHLIVHDWGGAIGMGVAVRWPARVKTLTILNSAAFLCPSIPWPIAVCRLPIVGPFLTQYLNLFARCATSMTVQTSLPKNIRKGYLFPYRRVRDRVAIRAFVKDIPMESSHPSYEVLEKIEKNLWILANKPVLLAWGAQDFCFHDGIFRRWREIFPGAQCVRFPQAGHYLLDDAHGEIEPVIRRFIVSHQGAYVFEGSVPPIPQEKT
jgi:haloalkane dehalogenase